MIDVLDLRRAVKLLLVWSLLCKYHLLKELFFFPFLFSHFFLAENIFHLLKIVLALVSVVEKALPRKLGCFLLYHQKLSLRLLKRQVFIKLRLGCFTQ